MPEFAEDLGDPDGGHGYTTLQMAGAAGALLEVVDLATNRFTYNRPRRRWHDPPLLAGQVCIETRLRLLVCLPVGQSLATHHSG